MTLSDCKEGLKYRVGDEVTDYLIGRVDRIRCESFTALDEKAFNQKIEDAYNKFVSAYPNLTEKFKSKCEFFKEAFSLLISKKTFTVCLEQAIGCGLSEKKRTSLKNLQYVFIDEAQDLNALFCAIIKRLIDINPQIKIVAVGDPMQAINRFIGAQTFAFNSNAGEDKVPFLNQGDTPLPFTLPTSYRLDKKLVKFVNNFTASHVENACTMKPSDSAMMGVVKSHKIDMASQSAIDALIIKKCVDIVNEILVRNKDADIVLLARTNKLLCGIPILELYRRVKSRIKEFDHKEYPESKCTLRASTIHKFKGLETDCVVIVDADAYPYEDNKTLPERSALYNDTKESDTLDAKCLFYVAITRARHELHFIQTTKGQSAFVNDKSLWLGLNEDQINPVEEHQPNQ